MRTDIEEGKVVVQAKANVVNDLPRGEDDGALGISQVGHPAAPAAAASPIRGGAPAAQRDSSGTGGAIAPGGA
ncbi:MAG: hypothetical protein AUH31_00340 [Armatimonadetes bacterium 13_1_40CM_64_14]|nr:MAG: hypothetical protein AUH31_00340 [Armatimonadetes bacterium 13_1_40CM_64_14]